MGGVSETWIGAAGTALHATASRFRSCTSGATAIEYAMVAVLFAVATIATWRMIGTGVGRIYTSIGNGVASAN